MYPPPRFSSAAVIVVVLGAFVAAALACSRPVEPPSPPPAPAAREAPPSDQRPPPGVGGPGVAAAGEPAASGGPIPLAVMIDNFHRDARPQIGLDRADVVYEFLVEGSVTRFMAVFQSREAHWVEPVRSVRTPSVALAKEMGAVLVHVGAATQEGEADAARRLAEWDVRAIDGDLEETPLWRDPWRSAPHNVATSTQALRERLMELGWTDGSPASAWPAQDDHGGAPPGATAAHLIDYGFALDAPAHPDFAAAWAYDEESNSYQRSMAGEPHRDGHSGEQLTAKNVVVQFLRASVVSREGHVIYEQTGEGHAWVFRDGLMIEAGWSKPSIDDRTRFWDTNGAEILLNRGATWLALLPEGSPAGWR